MKRKDGITLQEFNNALENLFSVLPPDADKGVVEFFKRVSYRLRFRGCSAVLLAAAKDYVEQPYALDLLVRSVYGKLKAEEKEYKRKLVERKEKKKLTAKKNKAKRVKTPKQKLVKAKSPGNTKVQRPKPRRQWISIISTPM